MGAQAKKASMIRRGITAMVGMAVVAGTLIGVAAPASASISNASISPATWAASEQAAATVTWTESAATTTNNIYTSGDYLSVEVGWGWTLANANPTGTPVQYTATWDGTAKTYSCATIGVVFASTGFTNTGGDIRCYVKQSSASAGNPGQQVVLSSVSGSNYFGLTAGSTINVTFAAGKVTAPSAGPASDTWRIISLTAAQTTTVTTVVPGADGVTGSLITIDIDPNGGECRTTKVTGILDSWANAPKQTDCRKADGNYVDFFNTKADGSGLSIAPEGNLHLTGDNRLYAIYLDAYAEVAPPGAPTDVVATGKWNDVQVNWNAPANTGTGPVTYYLVTSDPGRKVCFTDVSKDRKPTQCTLHNLTPGTQYTFQVQALNLAGWGSRSVASNAASPFTLKIASYKRDKLGFFLGGGSKISTTVKTSGYASGTKITPSIKIGDKGSWTALPKDSFRANGNGSTTFTKKFSKSDNGQSVSIRFADAQGNKSNEVVISRVK